jgi:hypothetical protein
MRDYSKVSPAVWQSERFNNLASDDARYLYLYLLTNEHQTMAGCYRLPDGYACADLRWPLERYEQARSELVEADLVQFDASVRVIGVTRWFKHNPPVSENHLTGIERHLERLPSPPIAEAALKAAQEAWESFEAAKAARAARKQKPVTGFLKGIAESIPSKLQTPYMAGKR